MGAGPKTVVPSPPAAAPRVGLLVSANTPTDEDRRWQAGITYDPETGLTGYTTSDCPPNDASVADDREIDDPPAVVSWETYIVGAGYRCTALAARRIDWRAKIRRLLEAEAERQISAELWSGTLSQAHGLDNRYLADGTAESITTGSVDPREGLALVEGYLADHGQRGMIHAPREIVSLWSSDGGLRRDGGLILTIHDTIVVPAAGYPSTGMVYATGLVDVRRGTPDLFGDPEQQPSTIGRDTNTVEVRAEQAALASWDGQVHGAVEVNVPSIT